MKKITYICNLCGSESIEAKVTAFEVVSEDTINSFIKLYRNTEAIKESDNHICSRCIGNIYVFAQKNENDKRV